MLLHIITSATGKFEYCCVVHGVLDESLVLLPITAFLSSYTLEELILRLLHHAISSPRLIVLTELLNIASELWELKAFP